MSAASDDLAATGTQTPFFVIQANNTEIFCEASDALRIKLEPYLGSPTPLSQTGGNVAPPAKSMSLVERINLTEDTYCTKEKR